MKENLMTDTVDIITSMIDLGLPLTELGNLPTWNSSSRNLLSLVDFPLSLQGRSVLEDLGLNILQYEKHTRLINSNY